MEKKAKYESLEDRLQPLLKELDWKDALKALFMHDYEQGFSKTELLIQYRDIIDFVRRVFNSDFDMFVRAKQLRKQNLEASVEIAFWKLVDTKGYIASYSIMRNEIPDLNIILYNELRRIGLSKRCLSHSDYVLKRNKEIKDKETREALIKQAEKLNLETNLDTKSNTEIRLLITHKKKQIVKDALYHEFKKIVIEKGFIPDRKDLKNLEDFDKIQTYKWMTQAAKSEGFKMNQEFEHENKVIERRKELLEFLKQKAQELGHTPLSSELIKDGKLIASKYYLCFGKISNAYFEAGLEPPAKSLMPQTVDIVYANLLEAFASGMSMDEMERRFNKAPSRIRKVLGKRPGLFMKAIEKRENKLKDILDSSAS